MSTFQAYAYEGSLSDQYAQLAQQLHALLAGETRVMTALSQASALLNQFLSDVNWVGFYLAEGDALYLGPFQGLPACTSIPFGKGVCGAAARTGLTQRVADVHAFAGHIACDARSRAEVVVPLFVRGQLWGVLDVDSPSVGRFGPEDELGLVQFVTVLMAALTEGGV